MTGRVYSASFAGVAISAVADIFEITGGSTVVTEILSFHLSQETLTKDEDEQFLNILWQSGQTTSGSGGATVTPRPRMKGDSASVATVERGNTTQASGGTIVTHVSESFNVRIPYLWLPTPEQTLWLQPSERGTWSIEDAPSESTTFNATVVFKEYG